MNELLMMTGMPKSSYFYQHKAQSHPDKYAFIREDVKKVFPESQRRYGYRRVHAEIEGNGTIVSEKVIRKIMGEEHLAVPYKKKRKYCSYMGEISPAVDNVVARDFHANTVVN